MEWGKSTSHIYYVPFTQSENIVPSPQPVDWGECTGERVQHPGLGKVQQDHILQFIFIEYLHL